MQESFNLFDDLASSEREASLAIRGQERKLKEASFEVRKNFGRYLANSHNDEEYEERFSYLYDKISSLVSQTVKPTNEVLAWLKEELRSTSKSQEKTAGFVKRSNVWQWDSESRSFKSSSCDFTCACGNVVSGIGQHSCRCGNIWNISSVTDGNKTAAVPLFICREVLRRDTVLASSRQADSYINPLDTMPPNPSEVTVPGGPDPSTIMPTTPDPSTIGTPEALGGSNSLNTPDANTMPNPVQQTRVSTKVDPLSPSDKNSVPQSEGYDLPELFGPAAGEGLHDKGWGDRMKDWQKDRQAALDLIFAADDEEESSDSDETNTPPPVEQPATDNSGPMGQPPTSIPEPPVENQPVEDQALNIAQEAILDLILREKREDVMGLSDTEQKQDLLEDAYQNLDTVQSIESAENSMPMIASIQSFYEGYIAGYLDRVAENSYEDRTTDYVGTRPPIPGVSNGLDDVIPATKTEDTTKELRSELAKELDKANGPKEEKPLDPAEPFGRNKTAP